MIANTTNRIIFTFFITLGIEEIFVNLIFISRIQILFMFNYVCYSISS